jgi:hypothetical protein
LGRQLIADKTADQLRMSYAPSTRGAVGKLIKHCSGINL